MNIKQLLKLFEDLKTYKMISVEHNYLDYGNSDDVIALAYDERDLFAERDDFEEKLKDKKLENIFNKIDNNEEINFEEAVYFLNNDDFGIIEVN